MGCDIHTYAEKRVAGKWESVSVPDQEESEEEYPHLDYSGRITGGRDYELFGLLSGVRRDWGIKIIPESQMCLPEDVSETVKAQWKSEDGDAHTEGWLDWQNLLNAQKEINVQLLLGRLEPQTKDGIEELMESFQRHANEYNLNVREMRIILWYDN